MILVYLLTTCLVVLTSVFALIVFKSRSAKASLSTQIISLNEELSVSKAKLNDLEISHSTLSTISANQESEIEDMKKKYAPIIDIEAQVQIKIEKLLALDQRFENLNEKYKAGKETFSSMQNMLSLYEADLEIMSFGLYKPRFAFETSEEFKQQLELNYLKQRESISADNAAICHQQWEVNGNKAEGRKMIKLFKKVMLYAFNGECDALIAKVKWNNATRSIERLQKSFYAINKLGTINNVEITLDYYNLKLDELKLTYEYENKKQDEKEEQRRIREQMREEEKVLRDIEKAKREADEDERRYQKALKRVQEDLKYASPEEIGELNNKVAELEYRLKEAEEKRERALSMAQQTKVGHIYIISNIGSFGENIYKIGMTRRLEPLDRIRELSDASVPFRYDVHAIIYSENAPALENELHKQFHDRRLNKVNGRKEFFKIELSEIESFVKQHTDAQIEFTLLAEAQEYRETAAIIRSLLEEQEYTTATQENNNTFPESLI